MRIVKVGINSPDWSRQVECKGTWGNGCGAVLEVGFNDLYTKHEHDIGGARTSAFCGCQGCGNRIEIPGVTDFIADLPTREAWEAANPDYVVSMKEASEKLGAMREAAEAKYGNRHR